MFIGGRGNLKKLAATVNYGGINKLKGQTGFH
jgi:hypothetical protein